MRSLHCFTRGITAMLAIALLVLSAGCSKPADSPKAAENPATAAAAFASPAPQAG